MANEITITNSQTLTVSVQPVDANGIPVGAPITQEFAINVVPYATQQFTLLVDEKEKKKRKKKEKVESKRRIVRLKD